jgi:hypothetical protein
MQVIKHFLRPFFKKNPAPKHLRDLIIPFGSSIKVVVEVTHLKCERM